MKLTFDSAMRIHILHKKPLTLLRVGFPRPKVQMVFLTEWQKVSLIDKLHHAHLPGWEVLSLKKKQPCNLNFKFLFYFYFFCEVG
jgi:hypothetical protein